MIIVLIMSFILLIGCSSKIDVNRDPDFQSRFLPYFSNAESEQVWLATVNDNMTQEARERFILPEYKVWTKETFKSTWSKVLTEEDSTKLKLDHLPIYTATQIQLVQMTDEEFLAQDYAKKKGQYALHIYFGEAFNDQEMSLKIQQEVRENIDLTKSKINRVKYAKKASERKEKLLGIDKYPIFILYDHKKLLIKTTDLQDISSFLARENTTLEEPFNFISEDFGFIPFEIPVGWQVVILVENYAMKQPFDLLDPEYEDVPEHIRIFFGIPAEENVYDLEEYNQNRNTGTTVHGKEVLYFTHPNDENPSVYLWLTEDEQYRYAFAHDHSKDKTLDETIPLLETLMTQKNN
jgi:hypothetical protein